ncbi:MAG: hypothetical protein M1813_004034 [Trichoglossum hirsutum]|nr:MAG: hypothetical protein M1813_004034 [Trichoglossum hirsutum]
MFVMAKNRCTEQPVLIQGRADWAFGYSIKRSTDGNIIAAMEVKQTSEFSKGEMQLLAYLSILHEIRHKAGKTNSDTQGFWTDGTHYTFMYIRSNGVVDQSITYNISMFETAIRSTSTKPEKKRDKDIECFSRKVWDRAYASYRDIALQLALELEEEEDEEGEGGMETD